MAGPTEPDRARAARSRLVGATIAGTVLGWLALQFVGARLGLSTRLMGLADLIVLGVLAWAIFMAAGMWRARRDRE